MTNSTNTNPSRLDTRCTDRRRTIRARWVGSIVAVILIAGWASMASAESKRDLTPVVADSQEVVATITGFHSALGDALRTAQARGTSTSTKAMTAMAAKKEQASPLTHGAPHPPVREPGPPPRHHHGGLAHGFPTR